MSNDLIVKNKINISDYSLLQYILFNCSALYNEIWHNKEYFVEFNKSRDLLFYIDYDEYIDKKRKYFANFAKNKVYKEYIPLVAKLFPSIKEYIGEKDRKKKSKEDDHEYNESVKNMSINNIEFFNLYFASYQSNYIHLYNDVLDFIKQVNSMSLTKNQIEDKISHLKLSDLKLFFDLLFIFVGEIDNSSSLFLINCLIPLFKYTSIDKETYEISIEDRLCHIIAELLIRNNIDVEKSSTLLFDGYDHIYYIYLINDYYIHTYQEKVKYVNMFNNYYDNLCEKIIDDNIDIMSEPLYKYRNLRAIYYYDIEKEREYVSRILNEDNVLNILRDLVDVEWTIDGYEYSIQADKIKRFVPNIYFKSALFRINRPLSPKEELVKRLYLGLVNKNNDAKIMIYEFIDFRYK